ncbi:uncharacterized protein LOC135840938 [Planococcus citri]|uniref:uncharacterized protein LOC135840938 n=1 Tax=Planococcus citri TaxID=170843 RepID=UPI0031F9497F
MTKYSTAIPATLILSLFSSVVHGQNHNDRNGKLLKTSNDFQCFSDGLHEDPNDCSVFYRCMDWGESSENSIQSRFTSMKFRCAEGTVFDIERSNCVNIDETSRLECRQLADDVTFSRIFERQAGEPDYGVVQPSSEYNQPYQPPSYNRPGPEEPSEQTPGDSGYGDGSNNEPPSSSTSPPCEADGFFPVPNDCTHFYRCVSSGNGFLKYDFSCGPGTVWDPDNNACNHPWATSRPDCRSGTDGNQGGSETIEISESPETAAQVAEPSSTTTAAPTTNRPTTRPTQTTTSSSYGRPSSTTSSSYGRPTSTTSSSYGRPSSTTSSSYGRPSSAKPSTTTTKRSTAGVSSTTTTTETPDSTSPVTEGSKENSTNTANSCTAEGFFPDEKNCTKFYRCVDEGNGKFTKYEFECAEGTVWDVQETTCNYPHAVQADNCNSTSSESQTSTTAGQSSASTSSSSQTSSRPPTSSTSSSYNRPTSQQSTSSNNQQSSSSQTTSSSSQTSSSSSSSQTTSSSSQTSSSQQTSSSSSSTSSQSSSSNQQTTSSQQSSSSTSSASSQNNTTASNATSTASSNNSSQTSKSDKCEEEGFFPSSENCNKFYRCVSNEAGGFTKYNFNCGPGTVWDPENNVCNHPWAVKDEKCRSGGQGTTPLGESTTESVTSSTQNGTSPLSTPTTEGSKTTTTTPSAETSSQGTTRPAESSSQPSTPPATTTESSSKPTEPSENSNATTTTEPTDGSTTPPSNSTETTTEGGSKNSTKPNNNGIKCEKAGYYPNPKDCKKFYRCVDWDGDKGERFSVYHFDCPEGTIFDPSLNICNHEESVYPPRDCSGSGSQTTDSPSTSKPDNSTTTESPSTTDSSNTTDVTTDISSEPTTLQTTTDASNNTTEPITTGPSETTPQVTTPSESTTKKEPETTTNAITTTPSDTTTPSPATTTQPTTQPTTTEISTTPSSSETCPELGPDQYALVCPTGFRRHPKYCNLFYQCTVSKTMDTKIVILSCVNGTLYDEKKIQCLPPDETKKCEGSMMADARNLKKTDDSVAPITVKSDKPICPNEGLFSYKDDCRLFYKCKKDDQGKLSGFLYQCPEGFAFWSISKRCEKTEKVPCENSKKSPTSWKSTLAPVESRNIGF